MTRRYDVLSLGVSFCDLIFRGMPRLPAPGEEVYCEDFAVNAGGAANTAFALSRLVSSTAFVSILGDDPMGRLAAARMREVGIPMEGVRVLENARTPVSAALSLGGERAFASYSPRYDRAVMRAGLLRYAPLSKHIHASLLDALELPLATVAAECGCTLSLDAACYEGIEAQALCEAAEGADILFVNGDEARLLSGLHDLDAACDWLAARFAHVAVKLGAGGARRYADGVWSAEPAMPADVCDATGAGDSFCAGYIAAWLRGDDARACLRYGNACGALALGCCGGINERLTPEAVAELMQEARRSG